MGYLLLVKELTGPSNALGDYVRVLLHCVCSEENVELLGVLKRQSSEGCHTEGLTPAGVRSADANVAADYLDSVVPAGAPSLAAQAAAVCRSVPPAGTVTSSVKTVWRYWGRWGGRESSEEGGPILAWSWNEELCNQGLHVACHAEQAWLRHQPETVLLKGSNSAAKQ